MLYVTEYLWVWDTLSHNTSYLEDVTMGIFHYFMTLYRLNQGFSKSETVGLPSHKALEKGALSPGIMIMLFDLIDTQQLSQDSLILLFDMTSDYTKYIKKGLS